MVKLHLSVHLDADTFHVEEPVTGRVILRAQEDVTYKELRVSTRVHCWGRGDHVTLAEPTLTAPGASLRRGEERTVPFSFPPPSWIPCHYGQTFAVGRELRAVAVIPMASDVRCAVPFRVTAEGLGRRFHPLIAGDPTKVSIRRVAPTAIAVAALLLVSALGGLGYSLLTLTKDLPLLYGMVVGLGSTMFLFSKAPVMRADRAIGNPQVRVEADHDARVLRCTLWMKPGATFGGASATLFVTEVGTVTYPDKANSHFHRHIVEQSVALAPSGTPGEWSGVIPMPDDPSLPYSFESGDGYLAWAVLFRVQDPDDRSVVPLLVWPERGVGEDLVPRYVSVHESIRRGFSSVA